MPKSFVNLSYSCFRTSWLLNCFSSGRKCSSSSFSTSGIGALTTFSLAILTISTVFWFLAAALVLGLIYSAICFADVDAIGPDLAARETAGLPDSGGVSFDDCSDDDSACSAFFLRMTFLVMIFGVILGTVLDFAWEPSVLTTLTTFFLITVLIVNLDDYRDSTLSQLILLSDKERLLLIDWFSASFKVFLRVLVFFSPG